MRIQTKCNVYNPLYTGNKFCVHKTTGVQKLESQGKHLQSSSTIVIEIIDVVTFTCASGDVTIKLKVSFSSTMESSTMTTTRHPDEDGEKGKNVRVSMTSW